MALVELRWFFLSFCHLGAFFFSVVLAIVIVIIVSIVNVIIMVTPMIRCEGFTSGDPAETKG